MTWTMRPVPWRWVSSWHCTACGICCRNYNVVLNYREWLNIVRKFGVEFTSCDLNRLYLKRKPNGSCVFLYHFGGRWLCGLQNMKPRACKLWPFKIYSRPKFGRPQEALFEYAGRKLFVYVDPSCRGIVWGAPTRFFVHRVLPEFVEIALGNRSEQLFSTSRIAVYPVYPVQII